MGRHRRPFLPLLPANRHGRWLVHHRLLPRNLPAEPLPRLPATEIRPVTEPGRGA